MCITAKEAVKRRISWLAKKENTLMPKGLYCFASLKSALTIAEKLRERPVLIVNFPSRKSDPEGTGCLWPSVLKIAE